MVNFPEYRPANFGNALATGLQASALVDQSRRDREKVRREEESRQYIEPALAGDQTAFGKLAAANPQVANSVATMLGRLDDKKKAAVKDAAEFTTQMGMGVLNAPPEAQASAYESARAEAQKRGMDITSWPAAWGPQAQGWVQFNVNKAIPVQKWFEQQQGMPTPIGGGGAPSAVPGGAPSPNRDSFVQSMLPHAMEVSKATGLDPRLVLAQSALETSYGSAAPGNNYFGIKSHDRPGGQTLATTEAGPGGALAPTQASFRTYADPGASARDYGEFLKTNPRYQPVLTAQGLDAQIDAMGKSGYATDPQYGAKLRQIAQTIQLPGAPPQQVAQAGGGFTPTNMPAQSVPGGLPQMPGGGAMPPGAGGQGDSLPGQAPGAPPIPPEVRGVNLPSGAQMMGIKGVPVVKDGTVLIRKQDGSLDWVPLPQRKEPGQGGGPFGGTGVEAQALNMLIANGTLTQQQAAELAAGKTITNPADGSVVFMTPSGIFGQKPGQQPQPVAGGAAPPNQAAPAQSVAPSSGMIPITAPKPQTMTEGQANAALYADRMRSAEKIILENSTAAQGAGGIVDRALNSVPGGLGTLGQSESFQKLDQAQRDFINAVLRRESGAVISAEEFDNARKQYFPVPGNPESVLKQKAENRRIALEGISRAAGPTYKAAEPKPEQGPAEKGKQQFDLKKKYGLE